jgi:hypothetical protein
MAIEPWKVWLATGLDAAVAAGAVLGGFRSLWRKRTIENVPTSKVAGVFIGLTEVKGRAESPAPLTSRLAEIPCVYFAYSVEEEWERWETETYRDSNGRMQTRTVRRSGWTTVESRDDRPSFFLRDETGALRVDPDRAEMQAESVFSQSVSRGDPLYFGKGPRREIADSVGRRRFTESAIRVGADLYVIGTARVRDDAVEAEIAHDPEGELFVISTRGEDAVRRGYAAWAVGLLIFAGLAATAAPFVYFGVAMQDARRALAERWPFMAGAGAAYAAVLGVLYLQLLYNGLVNVRNRVRNAWSQIDIQLKRRFDLIPALVGAVQGYAAHEKSVQEAMAKIRAASGAGRGGLPTPEQALAVAAFANGQTGALKALYGVVERYPALKADGNFAKLMDELSRTESRIALARSFYNESVTAYNNRIDMFPDALVARLAGLRDAEYFKCEDFERPPVLVKIEA